MPDMADYLFQPQPMAPQIGPAAPAPEGDAWEKLLRALVNQPGAAVQQPDAPAIEKIQTPGSNMAFEGRPLPSQGPAAGAGPPTPGAGLPAPGQSPSPPGAGLAPDQREMILRSLMGGG